MVFWDQIVIKFFSVLALIGTTLLGLYILDNVSFRISKRMYLGGLWRYFSRNSLLFVFIVSLTSMLGSLTFSEILKFNPCILCWYQRIMMYPIAFLSGLALYKKQRRMIMPYILLLSVIGVAIAGYHYLGQINEGTSLPCSAVGYSSACSESFFLQFGYITIPMMAFIAFLLIIAAWHVRRI